MLSYVDVPEEDAKNYMTTTGSAKDSEFILPPELVKSVKIVGLISEEADEAIKKAKSLTDDDIVRDGGWERV